MNLLSQLAFKIGHFLTKCVAFNFNPAKAWIKPSKLTLVKGSSSTDNNCYTYTISG